MVALAEEGSCLSVMWGSWGSMNKHMLPIILCSTKYKRQEKSRLSIYIKSMCMLLWVLNFFFPPQKNTPSLYISPQQLSFWLIVNWHTISIPVVPICGPWSASDPSSKLFVDTKLTVSLFFTECVLVQSTHVDGLSSLKTVSENGTFYFLLLKDYTYRYFACSRRWDWIPESFDSP